MNKEKESISRRKEIEMAKDMNFVRSYFFEYSKYCEDNGLNNGNYESIEKWNLTLKNDPLREQKINVAKKHQAEMRNIK